MVRSVACCLQLVLLCPQSEEALQATRLVLPPSPGSSAFLYNDELVFACSTGTGRATLPEEKISFNSPGEKLLSLRPESQFYREWTARKNLPRRL